MQVVDRGGEERSLPGKVAFVRFDRTEEGASTGNYDDFYRIE